MNIGNGACYECNGWHDMPCKTCEGSGLFDWAKSIGSKVRDAFFKETPVVNAPHLQNAPADAILYEAARRSYNTGMSDPIHGWPILLDTPTIKVFRDANGPRLIVAVRGTVPTDFNDLKADFAIASNKLESTDRFRQDFDVFTRLLNSFPSSQYAYFLTGHSLGSAIGLALQRQFPFIRSAVYYNGALQPLDLLLQAPNTKEVYISKDPLYRSLGRFWRDKEVYESVSNPTGKDGFIAGVGDALLAHSLDQFSRLYGSALQRSGKQRAPGVNPELTEAIEKALSDTDLKLLLGHNTSIMTYPNLVHASRIDDVLDFNGRLVLLYLTKSHTAGHWTGVLKRNENELEFFDPYGGDIDEQFDYIPDKVEVALGQTQRHLTTLLNNARLDGYIVRHNPYRFQAMKRGVNSCGRWVAARMLYSYLSINDFKSLVEDSGVSPDTFVTVVTEEILHKANANNILK
jgi:hypothetical protein